MNGWEYLKSSLVLETLHSLRQRTVMRPDQLELFDEYLLLKLDPEANSKRIGRIEVKLVQMNKALIYYTARRMPVLLNYMGDVEAVGCATLLKAVRTYDKNRGCFMVYAVDQLRSSDGLQSILRFYASGPIKIPHNAYVKYMAEKKRITETTECTEEYMAVDTAMNSLTRLDQPVNTWGDFRDTSIEQTTFEAPSTALENLEILAILRKCISTLEQREQAVITLLYGLETDVELNLRTIGEKLSVSHETVRKIRDQALTHLKRTMSKNI